MNTFPSLPLERLNHCQLSIQMKNFDDEMWRAEDETEFEQDNAISDVHVIVIVLIYM